MSSFKIIVCGAGLGGLGAAIALKKKGYNVIVLEGAPQLGEVGAGIQIPPNSSRVLSHYGVYDDIEKVVVWPQNICFKRYATGNVIGRTPLHPTMKEKYGFPYWLIHRADYHMGLLHFAEKLGVEIQLNSFVEKVDETNEGGPKITLSDGRTLVADIVVGADGVRSKVRESILGADDVQPTDSPNCAYRATVPRADMLADPEVAHLMDDINANCWIGGDRHIMAYPMRRNGELYNLVMSHPGKAAVGKWNEPGKLDEMQNHYVTFDPIIRKVLTKVKSCLKWKLADIPPLPRWLGKSGRVILIGDAAHAMVPYLAQGAATSIEDGAALAECIDRAKSADAIPAVLQAFQDIRKPRCEIIQAGSRANGDIWHLHDGPEQERRDRAMGGEKVDVEGTEDNPNRWSDKEFQPWLFGYDTVAETNAHLDRVL